MTSPQAHKKGCPILASGGDMYQPIQLRPAKEPLALLESRLRFLEAARPSNHDILALSDWVRRRDAVKLEIVLARSRGEHIDEQ